MNLQPSSLWNCDNCCTLKQAGQPALPHEPPDLAGLVLGAGMWCSSEGVVSRVRATAPQILWSFSWMPILLYNVIRVFLMQSGGIGRKWIKYSTLLYHKSVGSCGVFPCASGPKGKRTAWTGLDVSSFLGKKIKKLKKVWLPVHHSIIPVKDQLSFRFSEVKILRPVTWLHPWKRFGASPPRSGRILRVYIWLHVCLCICVYIMNLTFRYVLLQ